MATAKVTYIDLELDWLDARAKELKDYVDKRPMESLTERVIYKTVKGGGQIPIIAATIEQQITSHRAILMDYLKLTEAIAKARETEDKRKKAVRGDQELSPIESGVI